MMMTTTEHIFGKNIEPLGMVKGEIVQSKNIGRDLAASFKTIVGGELTGYTQMISEARGIATRRMVEQAEQLGADAIVGVRYSSSAIMQGAAEMLAFGTAVKFV